MLYVVFRETRYASDTGFVPEDYTGIEVLISETGEQGHVYYSVFRVAPEVCASFEKALAQKGYRQKEAVLDYPPDEPFVIYDW